MEHVSVGGERHRDRGCDSWGHSHAAPTEGINAVLTSWRIAVKTCCCTCVRAGVVAPLNKTDDSKTGAGPTEPNVISKAMDPVAAQRQRADGRKLVRSREIDVTAMGCAELILVLWR